MQENRVFTSEIIRIENRRALVKATGLMGREGENCCSAIEVIMKCDRSDKASKTVSVTRFITGNRLLWHNFKIRTQKWSKNYIEGQRKKPAFRII